ncbi:MAG: Short-chain dehydrogenase/reductase [Sphingobacteriaceae bacterium]|jgi:NAD(P)-dependent dehydrogenase (short-subunit alcohol dehydrogenase family)|nr:Short-chain dehydrogenase/reductase [Sphingobacteriaceae bacterium]
MPLNIDLSGKTVVITGASSGIGAGIAKVYARAGANIAGCAIEPTDHANAQGFVRVVEEESGKKPLYVQVDVTKVEQLEDFVHKAAEAFSGIDILASNAGTNVFRGAESCSHDDWLFNMNLNLESHWNVARLCKPYLEKSGSGVIIINSSAHSNNTMAGSFPYNVAKTGLKALVQSLTIEWGPSIRTVGLAPGFINTRLAEEYFDTFPDPQAERLRTEQMYPLKRLGTPEEIGGWFVFLSSPYAAFAGGQTYVVDGGRSAIMM